MGLLAHSKRDDFQLCCNHGFFTEKARPEHRVQVTTISGYPNTIFDRRISLSPGFSQPAQCDNHIRKTEYVYGVRIRVRGYVRPSSEIFHIEDMVLQDSATVSDY